MLRRMGTRSLKQFERADKIAFEIAARIVDRIAYTRLRREMDDDVGPVFGEQIGQQARRFDRLVDG